MKIIFSIALGGAVGAVLRHFTAFRVYQALGHGFPWGTFAVNVIGSLLIGALISLFALRFSVSEEIRAFLVVGVLGGFTTFSAFSLEVALLIERNEFTTALVYSLSSVVFAITALFLGMWAVRVML